MRARARLAFAASFLATQLLTSAAGAAGTQLVDD